MTVNLSTLLDRVRSHVSEISRDNMDDVAMYRELQKASFFIEKVKMPAVIDSDLETPIVCLAAYYAHVNYTLLNARQLGTIDESVIIRQRELKRIAKSMLHTISFFRFNDDLDIDDARYERMRGIGFAPTRSILDDRNYP